MRKNKIKFLFKVTAQTFTAILTHRKPKNFMSAVWHQTGDDIKTDEMGFAWTTMRLFLQMNAVQRAIYNW